MMKNKYLRFILYISTAAVCVVLDLITKLFAVNALKGQQTKSFIPYIFNVTYVENKGAAWGMFSDNRWVFMIISSIAIVALLFLLYRYVKESVMFCIPLTLVMAGGIGNMIDRVGRGYVIDFLQFDFLKSFPVFNVADIFITVGAVWLAVYLIFFDKTIIKESAKKTVETEADGN